VCRQYLQLSNVKPTQACSAPAVSQLVSVCIWAVTRTKAYRQSVSLNCANNILSQPKFAITGRNRLISMESLWKHFKNSKNHLRHFFMPTSIHPFQKYLSPTGDPVLGQIHFLPYKIIGGPNKIKKLAAFPI
jgi:hypothetical protein